MRVKVAVVEFIGRKEGGCSSKVKVNSSDGRPSLPPFLLPPSNNFEYHQTQSYIHGSTSFFWLQRSPLFCESQRSRPPLGVYRPPFTLPLLSTSTLS